MSTEKEILAFCVERWGEKDLSDIALELCEESGEVAGAVVKLPEGRATLEDLDDEIGDVLIVLSQIAARRGTTLEELRANRFARIHARSLTAVGR